MNYAVVYFFGILVFSTVYWFLRGRKFYTGPVVEEGTEGVPLTQSASVGNEGGAGGDNTGNGEEEKGKDKDMEMGPLA